MASPPEGGLYAACAEAGRPAALLLRGRHRNRNGDRLLLALAGEVVAVGEIPVELAGQLGGAGAKGGASALKKEHGHQAALGESE